MSLHAVRGGICPCRQCRRQCKIFASGVNFSIFTHFFVFFLTKTVEIRWNWWCKIFSPKIGRCKILNKFHVCTSVLISPEIFQFIACRRQGPLAWAGTSKGGKSSTWWRRPVEMEQRCEERSQRCSGKVQSCLQFAKRKSCCLQSTARKSCCLRTATTKSCWKPGTRELFT